MSSDKQSREPWADTGGARFATTHWSTVLVAADGSSPGAGAALERLCRAYWPPLYAFVRRQGYSSEDAQDLTQGFLARLLDKHYLALADRQRGRFRTFLLTALKHFLINEWEKARTVRHGGGGAFLSWEELNDKERLAHEPVEHLTPELAYEKHWASALLEQVLRHLRQEAAEAGRQSLFERLKDHLWGETYACSYAKLAAELGMTETAVKVAAHRLRQRFREVLRAEIAHTVASEAEIDDELRYLFAVVSR